MAKDDPLSDDYLEHYVPEVPSSDGMKVGDLEGFEKQKRKARDEYQKLKDQGVLDRTVESEGEFLAKMYVVAEHFGEVERFKGLLERGMRVRPDKVDAAADLFHSVALIYYAVGQHTEKYWEEIDGEHFVGKAADAYHDELATLTKYIRTQKLSLYDVAENTNDLTGKFADALRRWQKELAAAIREMAEYERNRVSSAVKGFAIGLVTDNPFEAAKETLTTLVHLFEEAEDKGKQSDALLKKIKVPEGFGLKDHLNDDVDYQPLVLPDPWDGKLK